MGRSIQARPTLWRISPTAALLVMENRARQAQKLESVGQLAAGIAHEINTPTQYVGDNLRGGGGVMCGMTVVASAAADAALRFPVWEMFGATDGLVQRWRSIRHGGRNYGIRQEAVEACPA